MAERIARETYELWRVWRTLSPGSGGGSAAAAGAGQAPQTGAAAAGLHREAAAEASFADGAAPHGAAAAHATVEAAEDEGRQPARVEVLCAKRGGPAQWVVPDSPAAAAAMWDTIDTAVHEKVASGSRRVASGTPRPDARGGAPPAREPPAQQRVWGAAEMNTRGARRFVERRMKLVGYFAEEFASTFGGEKERYIADLHGVLKEVPASAGPGVAA